METINTINLNENIIEQLPHFKGIHSFRKFLEKKESPNLEFAPIDVLYFFENLKSLKKYKQNTIYYYFTTVRTYCNAHFVHSPNPQLELQFESLFKKIKITRPYTVLEPDDIYFKHEIDGILKICTPKQKAFILTLFLSICRITELINIRLKDCRVIDSELTEITIQHGKGNRTRVTLIPTELYNDIIKIFDSKTFLFESKSFTKYHPRTIGAQLRELGAKFGKRLTPHLLRHSAITFLIDNHVDLSVISKLVGTSITVLLKTYNHPKFDKKAIVLLMKADIQNTFKRKTI